MPSSSWSDEAAQALFVWVSMLAADLTLQRSGHLRIDILANLLSLRARLVLDAFVILLAGMTSGRPMPMLGVRSSAATAALPVGFSLRMITSS